MSNLKSPVKEANSANSAAHAQYLGREQTKAVYEISENA